MKLQYPKRYAVYDTETTGLGTKTDGVTELAVKLVETDGRSAVRSWLIKQEAPLSAEIIAITGITDELLATEGVEPSEAWSGFVEAIKGYPLMGHNCIRFDNVFADRLIGQHLSFENLVAFRKAANTCVDTAAMFKSIQLDEPHRWYENHQEFAGRVLDIKAPGVKFNLKFACNALGIDTSDVTAHRAGGDVEMVDRIYRKMANLSI